MRLWSTDLFGSRSIEIGDGPMWSYSMTTQPEKPDDGDTLPDVDSDPVPEPEDE